MDATLDRQLCPRSGFGLVALAGSAGALPAYRTILAKVSSEFPVAIVVTHHMIQDRDPTLVELLQSHTPARVGWVADGVRPRPARVYVVPAGHAALLVADGTFRLVRTRIPFGTADALLSSMASELGPRGLAVILTGSGSDGSAGSVALRAAGGTVIAQDRRTSEQFGMPGATIARRAADFVFPLEAIGSALLALAIQPGAAVLLNRGSFEGGGHAPRATPARATDRRLAG